jgi:hypothetical protein
MIELTTFTKANGPLTKSLPRNNRVKMVVGLARWCNSTRRETHRA